MASSSSSNQYVTVVVEEEEYPYPSNLSPASFCSVKLSGRDEYGMWKTQMLCLIESHGMLGFIDGTFVSPQKTSTHVSGKQKVAGDNRYRLWRRSDALVKGWILGSLSKQTLGYVLDRLTHQDFSAKDVWDELFTSYGPAAVLPQVLIVAAGTRKEEARALIHQDLYTLTLEGIWDVAEKLLKREGVSVIDKITSNGNTVLHVAVGTNQEPEFLENLLELIPAGSTLLDVRNSDGNTLLHVAAIVGNTEAAKILVERNRDLLLAEDKQGHTPLAVAFSNMHTEAAQFLLHCITTDIEKDILFSSRSGDDLLVTLISSKDFGLARDLVTRYSTLNSDAVLMSMAQNFPCELRTLEKCIGTDIIHWRVTGFLKTTSDYMVKSCAPLCGLWVKKTFNLFNAGIYWIIMLFPLILKMLGWPFIKDRVRIHDDAIILLQKVCRLIKGGNDPSSHHHYYTNPILEATRQNAYDVVESIVNFFPNAIWSANEDGHNIIQYAVINRSENIYNILYQMSEHKNIYRTIKDLYGNNLLHLAARLAPPYRLNLISGAALQIQRELQWFKEVEGFVCPLNIKQKNSFGETPQMVFTREHKDLVIDGEKWMKTTAESYTITAALIITIVFAAAITVPGGNNQDTGTPLFTNNMAFTIFAIADAISLFAAVTSLLMFLSILTARFAEQDFLFKLPTRLIIGLTTLFISTTTMILAFGATLYLVFGQRNSRIIIPIAVLTCLPITSFVTLQFPLIIDLMGATYGRSIFGKKRDDPFY